MTERDRGEAQPYWRLGEPIGEVSFYHERWSPRGLDVVLRLFAEA